MSLSPREIAEQVRRMVAGEGLEFASLFAEDGVLAYPFGLPGHPAELLAATPSAPSSPTGAAPATCSSWTASRR